jgi:uncharacterized protein YjdB
MSKRLFSASVFLSAVFFSAPALSLASDYYVSPGGSGNGSQSSPMSISTLCGTSSPVHPGDTAWLRAGTYGSGGSSTINCQLQGTSSAPIKVRAYPGERATILGGLGVYSNYVWYWGIEISNNWTRSTSECGSFPSIKAPDGVYFSQGATGNKFINMVIHDVANGISDQQEAIGTESYGNLIYNNGWASSCDRGHGHALYLQNNGSSVKLVSDNLGWNSFDIGMQAYSGSNNVSNIWFVGNAFWNNGLPGGHRVDNLYIGAAATPKQNILVQDSVMYNPLDASSGETGYNEADSGSNYDITLKNNYWIGANPTGYVTLMLQNWQTTNVTGNMFVGPLSLASIGSWNWSGNSYYASTRPSADSGSPSSSSYPTGVRVMVRPNKYEQGRANIVVLNFDKTASVQVDLSNSGLTSGQSYEIRDAQNFYGSPVLTGTYYGGSVTLQMNLSSVSPIINYTTPGHTSAEFNAFVVLPTSGSTGTAPAPSPTVSISVSPSSASVNPGGTQQFSASVSGSTNTGVTWTVSPTTGSISSSGLYTAPATVSSQTSVTVKATSQADSTKSASATITLNASTTTSGGTGTNGAGASWWTFDTSDISGSTAIDGSGRGLNGLISNAIAIAGRVNQALSFNGSNSVVTVNSNSALDLVNNMTISTWLKTTNTSRTEDVMGKYDASSSEYGWILKTLPSGVVGLRVGGNNSANGVRDVADVKAINDGNWHHVAVVITLNSSVQFYIDGVLSSTQGLATKAAGSLAPLWIGTIPFNYFGMPFTGSLDTPRVDALALTASQIASLVTNAGGTTSTTPVAISVAVAPTSATMYAGTTQQFTATVTGTTNTAVTWSTNNGLGSISSSGLYTAPSSVSSPATVIVTATSQADSTKSGSSTITINPTTTTTPTSSGGTAASYSFDSASISGSTVLDGSGNRLNGLLSNTTAVTGRVNQALAFNGVNSVVTVASNSKLDLVNSMTISAWVKTTNNSRTEDVIGKYDASASEYGWIVKVLSSGVVGLRVGGNNSGNGVRDVADTTAINNGAWHHVAVVINLGSNVQFYIDGSLRSTQSLPTKAAGDAAPMWIGTIPFTYFGMPFTGSLDEVRIDAQALSASAIASLAGGTAPTTSTVSVSVGPSGVSMTSGGTQQFTASVSGTTNTAVTWSVSASGGSISSTGLYTAPAVSAQQVFTVTATSQADSSKSASVNVTVNPAGTTTSSGGAAAYWTFDTADVSGTTVLDKSGNGLNGIASGVTSVTGHSNQAFAFNGSNSTVTVADNAKLQLTNSMTIAAWVKTTNNSRTEDFIGKYDATGSEWGWMVKTLPSGVVGLRVGGNNTAGARDVADTTPINDGNWHHVAVVINLGSNVQFYIDGTLRSTQALVTVAQANTFPLSIGTLPFSYYGMPFTGSLDSVRVYNQALSGAAVALLAQ